MVEGQAVVKFLKSDNKEYLNWYEIKFASQEKKWFILKLYSVDMTFTVKLLYRNSSFLVLNIIIAFVQGFLRKLRDGIAELSEQFRDVFK